MRIFSIITRKLDIKKGDTLKVSSFYLWPMPYSFLPLSSTNFLISTIPTIKIIATVAIKI